MSSYQLSQEHNLQTLLWAIGGTIYSAAVAVHTAYRAIVAILPAVLTALCILCKALALVAVIVGIAAVVTMIPPTFWLGMAITGALAYVGYPRTAVR